MCLYCLFQASLALYSFANSQISTALKLLYRARYLTLLICGDNHPDIALVDVSKSNNVLIVIFTNDLIAFSMFSLLAFT